MRKAWLFSILFITLIITGCSNTQKLVCSQKIQNIDVNMTGEFEGDKLLRLELKYIMDLSQYTDVQINDIKSQDMCAIVKASMATYADSFTNCKQKLDKKNLIITGDIKKEANVEEFKSGLEKLNYSCVVNK